MASAIEAIVDAAVISVFIATVWIGAALLTGAA
jgi:hypothetical protein